MSKRPEAQCYTTGEVYNCNSSCNHWNQIIKMHRKGTWGRKKRTVNKVHGNTNEDTLAITGLATRNFYFQDRQKIEISGHFSGHQNDVFTIK